MHENLVETNMPRPCTLSPTQCALSFEIPLYDYKFYVSNTLRCIRIEYCGTRGMDHLYALYLILADAI